jgi:hypothetical protein
MVTQIFLAYHLLVYLWLSSSPETHNSRIRLYGSLCFATYYNHTRELFVDDPKLRFLIATDSLKVGNIAVCIEQYSPVNTSISSTNRLERRV